MIFRSTLKSVRYRPVRLAGTLVAFTVTLASMLALISILVSTTRNPGPPVLFQEAEMAVRIESVGAYHVPQEATVTSIDLRIDDEMLAQIDAIEGVDSVNGISLQDISIQAEDGSGVPFLAVGTTSHQLDSMQIASGSWPTDANEIVISSDAAEDLHADVGDQVLVSMPTGPVTMTIVGLAMSGADLDEVAVVSSDTLAKSGSQFLLIETGESADSSAVSKAISGMNVDEEYRVYSGGDVARIDPLAGSFELAEFGSLLGVMAGFMGMVAIFVILGTTGFAIQQRQGQIAVERAIGFTPRQVRKVVVIEGLLVSVVGSVAGLILAFPLVWVAIGLARANGRVPDGFEAGVDSTVTIALIPSMIVAVVIVAWLASRKTLDIAPISALRDAKQHDTRVSPWRRIFGLVLIIVATLAVAISAAIPPVLAMMFSLFVIIFAVWGISLIGPPIIRGFTKVMGPVGTIGDPVIGRLALTNTHRMASRVVSGISPVILGAGFLIMMFAFTATMQQGTIEVSTEREQAEFVVLPGNGTIPADTVDRLSATNGVRYVSPMYSMDLTSLAMNDDDITLEVPGFVVEKDAFLATTSLKVSSGQLEDWQPGSVIVSDLTSFDTSLDAGKSGNIVMPDGSVQSFYVAAIADNTSGSGDIYYLVEDMEAYLTDDGPARIGLILEDGASESAVRAEIDSLNASGYDIQLVSQDEYLSGIEQSMTDNAWATYLIIGSSAALGMISSINTLTMSTLDRTREFSAMRLIGATHAQVKRLAAREGALVGLFGVGVGILLALSSAASVSMALTGNVWAIRVPILPTLLSAAVAFAACVGSLYFPAILALRKDPLLEAGLRD